MVHQARVYIGDVQHDRALLCGHGLLPFQTRTHVRLEQPGKGGGLRACTEKFDDFCCYHTAAVDYDNHQLCMVYGKLQQRTETAYPTTQSDWRRGQELSVRETA